MDVEQRAAVRGDVFRAGELWVGEQLQPIDCLVRNSSAIGALIEVRTTEGIPELLRLTITTTKLDRSCIVVRRTAHVLGVAFC